MVIEYQSPSGFQLEPILGVASSKDLVPLGRRIVPFHSLSGRGLEGQHYSFPVALVLSQKQPLGESFIWISNHWSSRFGVDRGNEA